MKLGKKFKMQELILTAVFVMLTVVPSYPQIFLIESSDNNRTGTDNLNGIYSNVIVHGDENEQANYVPLCNGSLLLLAMGSMYLLRKREK